MTTDDLDALVARLERSKHGYEASWGVLVDAAIDGIRSLQGEYRKVEVLWKEAAIDASRKHDTIGGLENACRISLSRIAALEAERDALKQDAERYRWLRDTGNVSWTALIERDPSDNKMPMRIDERIDAAIDAAMNGRK